MNAWTKILSILAAIAGSLCCGLPVVLVLFGLGGIGVAGFLGAYHWYFTVLGILLLATAWFLFIRARHTCEATASDDPESTVRGDEKPRSQKTTTCFLCLATAVVLFFLGMNIFAGFVERTPAAEVQVSDNAITEVIPVEGMTCVACEILVEEALKKLPGIYMAIASEKHQNVVVKYEPSQVTIAQMAQAIGDSGYHAIVAEPETPPEPSAEPGLTPEAPPAELPPETQS